MEVVRLASELGDDAGRGEWAAIDRQFVANLHMGVFEIKICRSSFGLDETQLRH